jgi:hypothetical protein
MISLTGLTLTTDETMPRDEIRVHPEMFDEVRQAILKADLIRSIHQVSRVIVHPFTSVGDDVA